MFNKILLGHGSGGRLTHDLIKELLLKNFSNPVLRELGDSARIDYKEALAFTTDSFVVTPLKFPGADIGKLAVCGTINDLVVSAANPEYLSLGLIIEEGFSCNLLRGIIKSISYHAKKAGVSIVTGDVKVVQKGACDKIFINTSGIGRIVKGKGSSVKNIQPGDNIIITGDIGRHGVAVLSARMDLGPGLSVKSDCAALNGLILPVLYKTSAIKFMRDPTRGGLATTLNEIVQESGLGIVVNEKMIPLSGRVRAACEILGIDPLYMASEGIAVIIARKKGAQGIVDRLRRHPLGKRARIAGEITPDAKAKVILNTGLGTRRVLDMLTDEPLPRIC